MDIIGWTIFVFKWFGFEFLGNYGLLLAGILIFCASVFLADGYRKLVGSFQKR